MAKIVKLIRADQSGVFALPDGVGWTFNDVLTILVDGKPAIEGRYAIVSNNTAVDIFAAKDDTAVTVVLK